MPTPRAIPATPPNDPPAKRDLDWSDVVADGQRMADETYVDPGNPHGVDLTNFAETIVHLSRAFGVHPETLLQTLVSYVAEDEGGRGGVDSYAVRDATGELVDYVIAPHEEF